MFCKLNETEIKNGIIFVHTLSCKLILNSFSYYEYYKFNLIRIFIPFAIDKHLNIDLIWKTLNCFEDDSCE